MPKNIQLFEELHHLVSDVKVMKTYFVKLIYYFYYYCYYYKYYDFIILDFPNPK